MKITREAREALRLLVEPLDTEDARAAYRRRDRSIPNIDKAVDLTRRYRWDLFYAVKGWEVLPDDGITDAHIETVLRRVVPPL